MSVIVFCLPMIFVVKYFIKNLLCLTISMFRYSLFSAVSTVSPQSINPHLTAVTTLMLMSLKSTEGVTVSVLIPVSYINLNINSESIMPD